MNIYSVNGSQVVARNQGHAGHLFCDKHPQYTGPLVTKYVRSADLPTIPRLPATSLKGWQLVGSAYPFRRRVAARV